MKREKIRSLSHVGAVLTISHTKDQVPESIAQAGTSNLVALLLPLYDVYDALSANVIISVPKWDESECESEMVIF